MEDEAKTFPGAYKRQILIKILGYKRQLNELSSFISRRELFHGSEETSKPNYVPNHNGHTNPYIMFLEISRST